MTWGKYLNVYPFGIHTKENNISEKRWRIEDQIAKDLVQSEHT